MILIFKLKNKWCKVIRDGDRNFFLQNPNLKKKKITKPNLKKKIWKEYISIELTHNINYGTFKKRKKIYNLYMDFNIIIKIKMIYYINSKFKFLKITDPNLPNSSQIWLNLRFIILSLSMKKRNLIKNKKKYN